MKPGAAIVSCNDGLRPGVTRAMLASTLCDLERDGVVSRREFADGKVKRTEYTLTDNGKDLYPAFYALMKWGWKHSKIKQ